MRAGRPDSCTVHGTDPGGGSTAATALVSSASPGSSGPATNCRRTRCLRSMSTMTQAVSSRAIRRAHRCRVLDSLKPSFSSSSLATAVTRSSRRVMACTRAEPRTVCAFGLGVAGIRRSGRAAASRTAIISGIGFVAGYPGRRPGR